MLSLYTRKKKTFHLYFSTYLLTIYKKKLYAFLAIEKKKKCPFCVMT